MQRIITAIGVACLLIVGGAVPSASAAAVGDWEYERAIGPAGTWNQPVDIARDSAGNLYVADPGDHRIVKIDPAGSLAGTFGSFGTSDGQFGGGGPNAVAVDGAGNVFAVDPDGYRVEKFASQGTFLARFGTQGSGSGQFAMPSGIATDAAGNVFVSDRSANRVQKFSNTGVWISSFGSTGTGPGQLKSPRGLTVDTAGKVYVADGANGRIQVFTPQDATNYAFDRQIGTFGTGVENFAGPQSVKVDASGNLTVVDFAGGIARVEVFSPQGNLLSVIANDKTPAPGTDIGTETVVIDGAGTAWTTDIGDASHPGTVRSYRQFTTPVFTLSPEATARVGQPYSSAVGATAFPLPTYSVTAGVLPTGLALAPTGGITGTPTTAGSFTATITATTAYASAATSATITVSADATAAPIAAPSAAPSAAPVSGTVVITGTPAIGHSVRAVPKGWAAGTTLSYQWLRAGSAIAGSTSAIRHLTKSDLDKKITVVVRATGSGLSATSPAVTAGHPFTTIAKPRVRGTATIGSTLRVTKGTWSPRAHTRVRWYRDGVAIRRATTLQYRLTRADAGARITVTVTASKKHFATTVSTSARTARVTRR